MSRHVTPREKQRFIMLLREGYTQVEAARMIGKSETWAYRYVAELKAADLLPKGQVPLDKQEAALTAAPIQLSKTASEWTSPKSYEELSDVARDCLADPGRFRARFFGRKSSPWQEDAMIKMKDFLATPRKEFVVVNAPPGGGKSTLFTHDIPVWLTARSRTIRGFIGSAAQSTADSYTGQMKSTFEALVPPEASTEEIEQDLAYDAEATLAEDYGMFKPVIPSVWRRNQFTVAQLSGHVATGNKESTWRAWGEDSLFLGWRVNFIIWDDLVTDDLIGNLDRIEKQRRWWSNTAERRLEPGGVLVLQGQRMYADDLYKWCLSLDSGTALSTARPENIIEIDANPRAGKKYHHIVYKAHYEEKCKGDYAEEYDHPTSSYVLVPNPDHELHGTPHNPDGSGGCLLDPTRISYEECKTEEAKPFSQYRVVFQQEDVNPATALVPEIFVNGGKDPVTHIEYIGCKDYDRDVAELPPAFHGKIESSVISVDPSPSKYWSIQWWVYTTDATVTEGLTGTRYLMDHIRAPMQAPDFLDWNIGKGEFTGVAEEWVKRAKDKYPITHIIFEANAAQRFMLQYEHVQRWSASRGVLIVPHHTGKNKTDPEFGVAMIKPHWQFGRIRLPYYGPDARAVSDPLITEVTRYPDAVTDDCLMAHWFHEYQLQNLVNVGVEVDSLYDDMPSWVSKQPDTHRLFELLNLSAYSTMDKLKATKEVEARLNG